MAVSTADRPRILIADDEPDALAYYRHVLEQAGYLVATAQSAAEARQAIAIRRPDALVLDVAMPGVDGLTLAGRLYEEETTRAIPIVVVTALGSFGAGKRLLMELENIRRVLFKPFPAEDLLSGVDDVLRWQG